MANGIASDRPAQLQVAQVGQIGEDINVTPGVTDFMDAFRSGFITVDDINRRAADQVVRPSEVERDVAQNEQETLDLTTIRPQARELASKRLAAELSTADLAAAIKERRMKLDEERLSLEEAFQPVAKKQVEGAVARTTGTPEEQGAVIQDEQQRQTLEQYGQLFGGVPSSVDVPGGVKPQSFKQWLQNEPATAEHIASIPESPNKAAVLKTFLDKLAASPQIQAEYEKYKQATEAQSQTVQSGTPEYFDHLRKEVTKRQKELGVEAAKLKALPGILESQAKAIAEVPEKRRAEAQKLFMDYDNGQEIKDLRKVQAAFEKINKSITPTSTPPQDMSTIFSFMKILDPGSTVREGEYATAQNARGIPATISNFYNQVVAGNKLTPEQRLQFLEAARGNLEGQVVSALPRIKQFRQKEVDLDMPSGAIVPVEDTAFIAKFSSESGAGAAAAVSTTPQSGPSQVIQDGNLFERQGDGSFKFLRRVQ